MNGQAVLREIGVKNTLYLRLGSVIHSQELLWTVKAHLPHWLRAWGQWVSYSFPAANSARDENLWQGSHSSINPQRLLTANKRYRWGKGRPCFKAQGGKSLRTATNTASPFTRIRGGNKGSQQKKPEVGRCCPIWVPFPLKLCSGNTGQIYKSSTSHR